MGDFDSLARCLHCSSVAGPLPGPGSRLSRLSGIWLELEELVKVSNDVVGEAAPQFTGDVERDLLGVVTAYDAMVIRNAAIILDFLRSAPHIDDLAKAAPSPLVAIGRLAAILQLHQAAGNLREGDPPTQLAELLGPILLKRLLASVQPTLALSNDLPSLVQRYLYGRAP